MLRRSLYAARRSDLARGARTLATNAPKSGGPAATAAATKKAPAGGEEVDVVKRVFVEQQRKFRALLEKTKTLTPPVGGDAAAVKAYAAKKLAILKELQIATPSEKIQDTLDSAFAQSKTVRAYLDYAGSLRAELGLQDDQEMFKIMTTALDETEKALGGALETSNAQGMTKYAQAVQKACDAAGIKPVDMAKLGAEVDFEAIEGELAELKAVEDEVGKEQA